MAKEGINGVFGKPRPLRGKVGKTSDRLEEDAQAMEARLLQLRVSMMEEKQKRDAELPSSTQATGGEVLAKTGEV